MTLSEHASVLREVADYVLDEGAWPEIREAADALDAADDVLRKVEWMGTTSDGYPACPYCLARQHGPHTDGCMLRTLRSLVDSNELIGGNVV